MKSRSQFRFDIEYYNLLYTVIIAEYLYCKVQRFAFEIKRIVEVYSDLVLMISRQYQLLSYRRFELVAFASLICI